MTVDLELVVRESIYDAESARAGLERIKSLGVFPSKVDTTLRRLLLDICDSEDDSFKVLRKLLDFALNCSEKGFCGSELPLGLLEEAMDAQTISGCDELFGFLETHRQRMTARMGKGQALLRLCNELLRRLSKTEDTVFCGRILIFLSLVFPLSERSAVNLRGEFNTDNVTTYEQDLGEQMMTEHVTKNEEETLMSANSSEDLTKYSDGLYTTLWSLQGYLNNPMQLLAAPIVLANFHKSIAIVIEALQTIEQSMIKQSYSTASREPIQAQHSDLRAYFPPKFLTSRKLLPLELADLSFRRHILVQIMIVLDFLLGLTASSKEKWNSRGATTNKSLQIPYVLPVADAEWVSETRKRVLTIVEAGQDGVKFLIIVENALARDQDWLRWKCSGCPPYDLPPIEDKKILDAPKKVAALAAARKQYPHAVGNAVLSKLWASAGGWSDAELHNCSALPTPESYLASVQNIDAELEDAMQEDDIYKLEDQKASNCWRALRIARMTDITSFTDQVAGGKLANYIQHKQALRDDQVVVATADPAETTEAVHVIKPSKRPVSDPNTEGNEEKRLKMTT